MLSTLKQIRECERMRDNDVILISSTYLIGLHIR